jgi:hypothetical protein
MLDHLDTSAVDCQGRAARDFDAVSHLRRNANPAREIGADEYDARLWRRWSELESDVLSTPVTKSLDTHRLGDGLL